MVLKEHHPLAAAQPAEGLVDGDARQPGAQAVGTGELVDLQEGAHVRFLDHVLGLGIVADDAARSPEQPPVEAAHHQLVSGRIAAAHTPHQHGIRNHGRSGGGSGWGG